ncbi:MAG: RNA 2',3'-cyclic phosphodiesterase [Propionibacteriaceae bacterium]|nr:RNA 2',3'-cyclic phosphodiesterase [Propionibacteriaceae bacterium]
MRLFAGIELPTHVRDHLSTTLEAMSSSRTSPRNPWGPAVNWHITLGFFGEQPDVAVEELAALLSDAAQTSSPFDVSLAGAGVFRHDICWIGVKDPSRSLGGLAAKVRGPYATDDQHTKNRFHVTISRIGRRGGLEDLMTALTVYRGPSWTVDHLTLFRSDLGEGPGHHPLYTPLATAPLSD